MVRRGAGVNLTGADVGRTGAGVGRTGAGVGLTGEGDDRMTISTRAPSLSSAIRREETPLPVTTASIGPCGALEPGQAGP